MGFCILKLVAKAEQDLVAVRYRAMQIASFAFDCPANRARVVTAVSEIARNAITYAQQGKIVFRLEDDGKRQFLEITVEDHGPGIIDVESLFVPRNSGQRGITSVKALVDDLTIKSSPGEGTVVTIKKYIECHSSWLSSTNVTEWKQRLVDESPFSMVDDLEQQNNQLIETLEQLERYKAQLEEKTDQLRQANRYKGEFLANMSHEIRTPMNAVIGLSNILDRSELSQEQRKYVTLIRDAGKSLLEIINDILDFSKIEAGKVEIESIDVDLADLIEGTAELLAAQAQDKKLSLVSWIDPSLPKIVTGDPVRIRQILINLSNNAIKFTSEGEVIIRSLIKSRNEDDILVRFEVTDTGIGLSESQQLKLFQPFVQADGSTARKYGGTGLGLSICKKLSELMGGKIGVDSVEGRGSTFWFELPFNVVDADEVSTVGRLPFESAMIVEDHCFTRRILREYVESFGIKCDTAESAEDALKILDSNPQRKPDFFIVDYLMGEVNGLELTRQLRSMPRLKESKIIFLTAFNEADLGNKAVAAGSNAFLTKPIRHSQLYELLQKLGSGEPLSAGVVPIIQAAPKSSLPAAQGAPAAVLRKIALLAEDNLTNQMVATIELERLGVNVQVAEDGQEALRLFREFCYDIVLMDCQMPVMDGFEATREIRKFERSNGRLRMPIIAMTANALPGDREKCIEAGMDDYITKPFDPTDLSKVLSKWIKSEQCQLNGEDSTSFDATPSKPLDIDLLKSRFGNDKAMKLAQVFITDTKKRLIDVSVLIERLDFVQLARQAHAIKGAASMIYAIPLSEQAKRLEVAAKAEESGALSSIADSMRMELSRLETAYSSLQAV